MAAFPPPSGWVAHRCPPPAVRVIPAINHLPAKRHSGWHEQCIQRDVGVARRTALWEADYGKVKCRGREKEELIIQKKREKREKAKTVVRSRAFLFLDRRGDSLP